MYRVFKKDEFYTRMARKEGYPARSAYKLEEINKNYNLFKEGDFVLDLGCAPGSWILYVLKNIGRGGKILGVDLSDLNTEIPSNVVFLKKNISDLEEKDFFIFGRKFDNVIADLAPNTCGIKELDCARSLELSKNSFEIAKRFLLHNGNFVCKIFEGRESDDLFKEISESFEFSKRVKPKAVMKNSREFYIVAKGFEYGE
jgi:23S rRNA (uridine2552-2'-O)-methyltransferase